MQIEALLFRAEAYFVAFIEVGCHGYFADVKASAVLDPKSVIFPRKVREKELLLGDNGLRAGRWPLELFAQKIQKKKTSVRTDVKIISICITSDISLGAVCFPLGIKKKMIL